MYSCWVDNFCGNCGETILTLKLLPNNADSIGQSIYKYRKRWTFQVHFEGEAIIAKESPFML